MFTLAAIENITETDEDLEATISYNVTGVFERSSSFRLELGEGMFLILFVFSYNI